MKTSVALAFISVGLLLGITNAQPPQSIPASGKQTAVDAYRSFNSIGKQTKVLKGGNEVALLEKEGKGQLHHMWFGGNGRIQDTIIRVYVDGEDSPSIEMKMSEGFCNAWDSPNHHSGSAIVGKLGHKGGVYNTIKIPYGTSIKVTAQNDKVGYFWWILRGTENLPLSIGGVSLPETARLKLHVVQNKAVEPYQEFDMCDTKKDGLLYMVYMQGEAKVPEGKTFAKPFHKVSFLEAIMRAYVGGNEEPDLLSSGLEDYFLGTYYFNTGRYSNDLAGLTFFEKENGKFAAYRIHERDPYFYKGGLRLTCKAGEHLPATGEELHDSPPAIYTTYTWVYEW